MRKLTVLFLLLLASTTLFAQGRDDDWRRGRRHDRDTPSESAFELTPFIGYRWGGTILANETSIFDRDVDVASSADFGVTLGIPLGESGMKLELLANRQQSQLETGSGLFEPNNGVADIDVTYLHAGLQVPFTRSRNATTYGVFSLGLTNLDPQISGVSADNRFSASAGVGVKVPMNRSVSLHFEGRGFYTSLDNNRNDCSFCSYSYNRDFYQGEVNVGLTFSF